MKKNIVEKSLAFGVIVLLIGLGIVPTISDSSIHNFLDEKKKYIHSQDVFNGKTLYVGGIGPNNYSHIQDAIDNASNGDTVYVYDDSSPYFENIIVDKEIGLFGENQETTVVNGGRSGDVIYVSADNVIISGFTIQQSGGNNSGGIVVRSSNNIVTDNIITLNFIGIRIDHYGCNNIIANNIITDNHYDGLQISSDSNSITNNVISDNIYGIDLCQTTTNNSIKNNIINNNRWFGIMDIEGVHNFITGNVISDNAFGIILIGVSNCIILNNTISKNGDGISLSGDSLFNEFYYNNIMENNDDGITLEDRCNFNEFCYNNIMGNRNQDAHFYDLCILNRWNGNYWDRWSGSGPYIIRGTIGFAEFQLIPWVNFDWHPASGPIG